MIRSSFSALVLEPRRLARTKRRIERIKVAFLETENIASRGEYAIAISAFRKAFSELTRPEQDSIGSNAFFELWKVLSDNVLYRLENNPLSKTEMDALFKEGILSDTLFGELNFACDDINKRFRAYAHVVVYIETRAENYKNSPRFWTGEEAVLTDEDLAKIKMLLE